MKSLFMKIGIERKTIEMSRSIAEYNMDAQFQKKKKRINNNKIK